MHEAPRYVTTATFFCHLIVHTRYLHSFPTRRSSDLALGDGHGRGMRMDPCHVVSAALAEKVWTTTTSRSNFFCQRSGNQDRKSTRLNSSHLGISYAVFCLKKKK